MHTYKDVFAWPYKDLVGVPTSEGVHTIPLLEGARPVRGRAYKLNPKYAEAVRVELKKSEKARIIIPVEHSDWLSPMVIAPKKQTNKIRVWVNFCALNKVIVKDGFLMPFCERVLKDVARRSLYNFMDEFSGYNQIAIHPDHQAKTVFVTPWSTFVYTTMAFELQCPAYI